MKMAPDALAKPGELWITHSTHLLHQTKHKNVEGTIGSQIWGYSPEKGWITPDGEIKGEDGPWPFNKKKEEIGKQVFSEVDPYGEENW
jgi:hypothetical protein